jgi:hypothetical protein
MEALLIDIGALAMFLGYVAIVYWHAASPHVQPPSRRPTEVPRGIGAPNCPDLPGA